MNFPCQFSLFSPFFLSLLYSCYCPASRFLPTPNLWIPPRIRSNLKLGVQSSLISFKTKTFTCTSFPYKHYLLLSNRNWMLSFFAPYFTIFCLPVVVFLVLHSPITFDNNAVKYHINNWQSLCSLPSKHNWFNFCFLLYFDCALQGVCTIYIFIINNFC